MSVCSASTGTICKFALITNRFKLATGSFPLTAFDHDSGFEQSGGRDQAILVCDDGLEKCSALWFVEEDGGES